jgi:hypothetical protein
MELVKEKFGQDKLNEILDVSDMSNGGHYMRYFDGFDILDEKFLEIVKNLCMVLHLTKEQASDAFGEYWICEYAPKMYKDYYDQCSDARSFLLGLDSMHGKITADSPRDVQSAHPPLFDTEIIDENTFFVHYKSKRMMIDFYTGLVKGIGKYFNTPLSIKKVSEEDVEIRFGKP